MEHFSHLVGNLEHFVRDYGVIAVTAILATLVFSSPQVFLFAFLGATGRASLLEDKPLGFTLVSILVTVVIIALIGWRVRKLLGAK